MILWCITHYQSYCWTECAILKPFNNINEFIYIRKIICCVVKMWEIFLISSYGNTYVQKLLNVKIADLEDVIYDYTKVRNIWNYFGQYQKIKQK